MSTNHHLHRSFIDKATENSQPKSHLSNMTMMVCAVAIAVVTISIVRPWNNAAAAAVTPTTIVQASELNKIRPALMMALKDSNFQQQFLRGIQNHPVLKESEDVLIEALRQHGVTIEDNKIDRSMLYLAVTANVMGYSLEKELTSKEFKSRMPSMLSDNQIEKMYVQFREIFEATKNSDIQEILNNNGFKNVVYQFSGAALTQG